MLPFYITKVAGVSLPFRGRLPDLALTLLSVVIPSAKHGVIIEEVQEAFEDPQSLITRGRWETRLIYGRTEAGRYLLMVTRPEGRAVLWLVTARDMTGHEKDWYRTR